ncbi:MAG: hypothetical protein U0984_10975 [Prosthecobacter sp.]|nr:hypothetical protein [Prosthecobacter sp.]
MDQPEPDAAPAPKGHLWGLLIVVTVLVAYAALAFMRHSSHLVWDEVRYLKYAERLTHGYYVNPGNPDFVNGPGYPIVLMPFTGGGEAWLWARLLNAFFMAGAAGFVWLTVRCYAGTAWAAAAAVLVGFHPTLLWMGFALMTEPLAMFCLCGFVWSFCNALWLPGRQARRWIISASLFLGWLVLTRVFFGHVLVATACACLLLLPFLRAWGTALRRTLLIMSGAFLLCVPYLAHTWQKTGQVLCWSTNSGELLYWMTSTHSGENGHWFSIEDAQDVPEVASEHAEFYARTQALPVLEREAAFKTMAMQWLKADPKGVFYNWLCNVVRLAFGFPRSHQEEELRTVVLVFVNGVLILLASVAGLIALRRWRSLPAEIWLLQIFIAFYLGGSSLAPALPRYFVLAVPILLLGLAATFHRNVRVSLTRS